MKRYSYIGIVIVIVGFIMYYLIDRTLIAEQKWKNAAETIKAYEQQFSSSESKNRAYKVTISQLKYSKDSVFQELNAVRKELKIKDSKLKSVQYISSDFIRKDTITLKDTIFRDKKIDIDTLLSDEWYSVKVGLKYPSTVTIKPEFKSKKYIMVSSKKETVNPPSKFFLFRWFQRKHIVLNINVIEKNPYVHNENNRYVEIVK